MRDSLLYDPAEWARGAPCPLAAGSKDAISSVE